MMNNHLDLESRSRSASMLAMIKASGFALSSLVAVSQAGLWKRRLA